jgi:hypothetical protein
MLFRELPDEVVAELRAHAWLDATREVTVVRALDGCVRICVETEPGGTRPTPAQMSALEGGLRARIGPWLGAHQPVWAPRKDQHRGVVDAIRAGRRPWPRPLVAAVPFRLHALERHAARHGWVGDLTHAPPWSVEDADAGTRPPIVTFFSHKGGVGRSTALAAVAVHLAERGLRVLAIDLDLEAPGLGTLLADPAPTEPGLLDLLVGPNDVVDQHVLDAAAPHAARIPVAGPPILVVKAGEVDEGYLDLLARVDLHGLRDVEAVTNRLRDVVRRLVDRHGVDVVLLDARTGFADVGGVALGALSHGAVFLGLSNEQSWQGLRAVARMLASAGHDEDGDPRVWLQVVHALAPAAGDPVAEERFARRAYDVLCEQYYLEERVPQGIDVVALPFREALRGAGDQLTPSALAVLREAPWASLANAIAERYARLARPETP